jgi:hypothetical protein
MPPSVLIGIPCRESAPSSAFYNCLMQVERPPGTAIFQARTGSLAGCRNRICREAIRAGAEWVWQLDDDQLFPPDTLLRLLAHQKDAVIGLTLSRKHPFAPLAFQAARADGGFEQLFLDDGLTGLVPITAAGLGGLLLRTSVLEWITDPYFVMTQAAAAPDAYAEDFPFYRRLAAAGVQLYLDLDTPFGHTVSSVVWPVCEQGTWMTVLSEDAPFAALPPARAKVPDGALV